MVITLIDLYILKNLEIYPFLPDCPFIGIYLLIIISYDPLYFCAVYCNFSLFLYNFINLRLLLFLLVSLANDFSILFIFSKDQHLFLVISAIVSFISFTFISAVIFMISFLLSLGVLLLLLFFFWLL